VGGSRRIPKPSITNTILEEPHSESEQWSLRFQSLRGLIGALWALEPFRRFGSEVRAVVAGYAAVESNCLQQLPTGQLGLKVNKYLKFN